MDQLKRLTVQKMSGFRFKAMYMYINFGNMSIQLLVDSWPGLLLGI